VYRDRLAIERAFRAGQDGAAWGDRGPGAFRVRRSSRWGCAGGGQRVGGGEAGVAADARREEFEKLSGYYLADEVAGNYRAVDVLVAAANGGPWVPSRRSSSGSGAVG